MPAVKNVGEPCAGEPHARFEVAAGGNQASRASTCRAAQAPLADPTKRHSFASLLLHEGRSVIYVARQLGHDARLTLTRYGHVIDELEDRPRITAESAIADARLAVCAAASPVVQDLGS